MTATTRTRTPRRTERIETRMTSKQKALFAKAAELKGTTVEDLLVQSADDAAARLLDEFHVIELSGRDQEAIAKSLLSPPKPMPRLRAAAAKYRKAMRG